MSVTELLGWCVGVVGLSLADFLLLTPREAEAVCSAHREAEEMRDRGAWERSRLVAYSAVSPYLGKKGAKSPEKWLPLPWDRKRNPPPAPPEGMGDKNSADAVHAENRKAIALLKRLNGG